ncbi:FG-GAP repeat domain-containing protein [Streptomyces sp. NPDC002185]|uniref:FG-GAP repeat domain-containing protein n=1 Tax=Streptomyces sp. NPDC002185 TaxID=3364636 RepID=UPI0036C36F1C
MNAYMYDQPRYGLVNGYSWDTPAQNYPTNGGPADISSIKLVPTLRECEAKPYPYWETATSPRAAGFGDMNGDRRADAVLRDEAGSLWFMPGAGAGTGRLIGSGGWNTMNALVRHGDFSRDGREDVIARERSTGKLWLYPGTGNGSVGARKLIGGGWNTMGLLAAFGDLSGDGRSDLLGVEKSTGKLWLYPGTSGGALGARKLIGGGWNSMNALVGAGDMTGDGRADLVARERATGKLWLYPGTSARTLGARKLIGTGGWNAMDYILGVGDTSGDGRPDLEASDGFTLFQYGGLAGGGLRKLDNDNGSWWGLEGGTAF